MTRDIFRYVPQIDMVGLSLPPEVIRLLVERDRQLEDYLLNLQCGDGEPVDDSRSRRFEFSGVPDTFVVPPAVGLLTVDAYGAAGGNSNGGELGGRGGRITCSLSVVPGESLVVYVGGRGGDSGGSSVLGVAGFNGGAAGGEAAGGGGGASDVRRSAGGLSDREVVAGGGGGAGGNGPGVNNEGHGGFPSGGTGTPWGANGGGGGGTQSTGGGGGSGSSHAGSPGAFGTGGTGGTGALRGGGGGGGGLYGGGGGGGTSTVGHAGGGGGGGSGKTTGVDSTSEHGSRPGDGLVIIRW